MIRSFTPLLEGSPKVLILGSIPSVTSLESIEYYAFKQNRFWKIISKYFNCELNTYEDKKECLFMHHIALWDVIQSCNREGSLDSKISNVEVNDIELLLKGYPSIEVVICNGAKSASLYKKFFNHLDIEVISLPSTSNANQSMKQEKLFELWIESLKKYV